MTGFIRDYGLIIVFLTIALETSGLPLPGETALVAAAVLASQGHYSIEEVIVVAFVVGIAMLAAAICTFVPTIRLRAQARSINLRDGGRGETAGRMDASADAMGGEEIDCR